MCLVVGRRAAEHEAGSAKDAHVASANKASTAGSVVRKALASVDGYLPYTTSEECKHEAPHGGTPPTELASLVQMAPSSLSLQLAHCRALHRAGKFAHAVEAARAAHALDGTCTEAQFLLGWCLVSQGQFAQATATFVNALKGDPDAAPCRTGLKLCKAVAAGKDEGTSLYKAAKYEDAAAAYAAASQVVAGVLPHGVGVLHTNVAAAKLAVEDYTGALEACNAAVQSHPFLARAYERRGKCFAGLGKWSQAAADFTHAAWLDTGVSKLGVRELAAAQVSVHIPLPLDGSCPRSDPCAAVQLAVAPPQRKAGPISRRSR